MVKKGHSLEVLISNLEKIKHRKQVKIETNKFLPERETNIEREFDVLITLKDGISEQVFAIECKDWVKSVGLEDVDSFYLKCLNVGIQPKAIVSKRGFTKNTRKKAQTYGISCLKFDEAESFPWLATKHMTLLQRTIKSIYLHATVQTQWPNTDKQRLSIINHRGQLIDNKAFEKIVRDRLTNDPSYNLARGDFCVRFHLEPSCLTLRDNGPRESQPIQQLLATVEVSVRREQKQFKTLAYENLDNGDVISEIALCEPEELRFGSLALVSRPKSENGGELYFLPNHNKNSQKNVAKRKKKRGGQTNSHIRT